MASKPGGVNRNGFRKLIAYVIFSHRLLLLLLLPSTTLLWSRFTWLVGWVSEVGLHSLHYCRTTVGSAEGFFETENVKLKVDDA